MNHQWPADGSCVWGPWMNDQPRKGTQKPTQYRQCVHPLCKEVQRQDAPGA